MRHTIRIGAPLAALLSFSVLQACTVQNVDENVGTRPDEIVELDDGCELGEFRFCDQEIDATINGEQTCIAEEDVRGWNACAPRQMDGPDDCRDGEAWDGRVCVMQSGEGSTPIVLSFDRKAVHYTQQGAGFDLTGVGLQVTTDWPTSATPWLARDRDGNGVIEGGGELFGSATTLESGRFARHGFEALVELDEDGDGALTAFDTAFDSLVVWTDDNHDRVSQPDELKSLTAVGITALSLDMQVRARCDDRGNCERERASFTFIDAEGNRRRGAAIDVHLAWQ